MYTLLIIVGFYSLFFVGLYGGVWMSRKASKSLRRRKDIKRHRAALTRMAKEMVTPSNAHKYDKKALEVLTKTVTRKGRYN